MAIWTGWLILAGVCFVAEIATEGFLIFWFGVGALAAMGVSFFITNMFIQFATFVVVSTILTLCTRKLLSKIQPKVTPSNVYTIIGKKAVVTVAIDPIKSLGQIKVEGDIWSAKTKDEEIIPEGTTVEILEIEGVKAVVKRV